MSAKEFILNDIKKRFGDNFIPSNTHFSFNGWVTKMEEYAKSVHVSRNIMCGFDLDDMRDAWESSKNNPKTFDEWIEGRNRT